MLHQNVAPGRTSVADLPLHDAGACVTRIRFELVRDASELPAIADAWNALFAAHAKPCQVFQSHTWVETWCRHYLPAAAKGRLAVGTAWQGDELVAVLPMVTSYCAGLTILRWLGEPVSQYGDAIVAPHARPLLQPLLVHVAHETRAGVMDLRKVREDAAIRTVVESLGGVTTAEQSAPFVDLSSAPDADAYLARFSSNSRKQRRRRRRRLEEAGAVRFDWMAPGREAANEAAVTVREKRATLPAGDFTSALDARFEAFFADIAAANSPDISCRVSLLHCGDKVIAREIGLVAKEGYVAHVGTFDADYGRFAPGTMQIDETIGACCSDGIATYDFLAPANDYKVALADGQVPVRDYAVPFSRRGALYGDLMLRSARPVAKRVRDVAMKLCKR